jgi:hypothetical protein
MHPRLDEIRKRLLTPPITTTPARYKAPARSGENLSAVTNHSGERTSIELKPNAIAGANTTALNSSQTGPLTGSPGGADLTATENRQAISEMPNSPDGLARAVAELFEPARQCQGRVLEIAQASKAISKLTMLALELREPLNSFHDNIRKLSRSFESMRTFRDELGVLAESFAPVRPLHHEIILMAQTVRTHLAEVANGLEPAKAIKVEIADLATAIDSVSELQAQFYELSEAFGGAGAKESSLAASETDGVSEHSNRSESK